MTALNRALLAVLGPFHELLPTLDPRERDWFLEMVAIAVASEIARGLDDEWEQAA